MLAVAVILSLAEKCSFSAYAGESIKYTKHFEIASVYLNMLHISLLECLIYFISVQSSSCASPSPQGGVPQSKLSLTSM